MNTTSISVEISKRRAAALDFNVPNITFRYMEKQGVSKELAELHERECKRYLLLCSLFPGEGLGMRGPVDEYWHTFLLFTKEYQSFCDQVAGHFIHHVPSTPTTVVGRDSFRNTMRQYLAVFGEVPDARAWPDFDATCLTAHDNCTCEVGGPNDPGGGGTECAAVPACNGDGN